MLQARMIDDTTLALIAGGGPYPENPVDIAELVDLPRNERRLKLHKADEFDIGPSTPDEIESQTSGASGSGTVAFRM